MKKIYSLLLSLVMLSAFTACTSEVDDAFDQSSAERIASTINNDTEILTSASNGWLMKYYADPQYGGYNVYCKFDADGNVSIQNELYGDTIATSHYTLSQSQGVVLSFDTYNELIHVFSDPDASIAGVGDYGTGMTGDFEFRVLSACADSVVLKGKKHGMKVVMVPMPANTKWADYTAKVKAIENAIDSYSSYNFVTGSDTIKMTRKYRQFSFTDPETGNSVDMPYIVTDKGMELYSPVSYKDKTISGFTYSDDNNWLSLDDSAVKICPRVSLVALLVNYDWYFLRSGLTDTENWDKWIASVYPSFQSSYGAVSFLCFTAISDSQLAFYCRFGKYAGYLAYNIVEVSDKEVTFEFTKSGNSNGTFLYSNCYWSYITSPFSDKTFTISVDDVKNPGVMTLTEKGNPSNVITLTTAEKTDPFNN